MQTHAGIKMRSLFLAIAQCALAQEMLHVVQNGRVLQSHQHAVSGETSATGQCGSATSCGTSGSNNYVSRNLTYDTSTGKFTGYIITNTCPGHASTFEGAALPLQNTPNCIKQTFPAPAYATTPVATAFSRVGLSIRDGTNMFGPMEAGFTTGQACDNGVGSCDYGWDLDTCKYVLEKQCGTSHVRYGRLPDDCGGHASPYHYHTDASCEYTYITGHSPLVGVMLDGRGLYGPYESTITEPTNLDACNGHYGPVPSRAVGSDTYPAATNVYHYHVTSYPPYFVGCYGPVSSVAQAKALYTDCDNGDSLTVCTSQGSATIDPACPVYGDASNPWSPYSGTECTTTSTSSGDSINPTAVTGIAVGVAAGVLAIVVVGVMVFVAARTRNRNAKLVRSPVPTPESDYGSP